MSVFVNNTKIRRLLVNNFTNLRVTEMFNMTKLYGDIAAFKDLTKLRRLTFNPGNTGARLNIYGDIANISNKPDLVYVELAGNNLSGSINDLANLPNLVSLGISYSQNVTGNISVFANCPKLDWIAVPRTNVSGSVNSLANLTKLRYLDVNNLNIPHKPGKDSI